MLVAKNCGLKSIRADLDVLPAACRLDLRPANFFKFPKQESICDFYTFLIEKLGDRYQNWFSSTYL